jgi:hypothetical protein
MLDESFDHRGLFSQKLPLDKNFWPHLSIHCVQNRLFGMREVVGNLVVTDLQKYLEKPAKPRNMNNEALADALNDLSKRMSFDFNRVRRSIIDAYEGNDYDRGS